MKIINEPYYINEYETRFFCFNSLIKEKCPVKITEVQAGERRDMSNIPNRFPFIEVETKQTYKQSINLGKLKHSLNIPFGNITINENMFGKWLVKDINGDFTEVESKEKAIELATTMCAIKIRMNKKIVRFTSKKD